MGALSFASGLPYWFFNETVPVWLAASGMSLAAIGLAASVLAWLTGAGVWWLAGGILLGSVIPFTLVVIMPVNKQLLEAILDKRSAQTRDLLSHWGKLHAVRSVLSGIALVIFLLSA